MTLWQRLSARLGPRWILRLMRFWPPYLGAGVRVTAVDPNVSAPRWLEVAMDLTPLNRNYVGTHFGGSLYAMCDPFYMFLTLESLGRDYVVWDKAATIDFIKPGRGRVMARFELDEARLDEIRAEVEANGKSHPRFEVIVKDEHGDVVARVGKVLSVKKRPRASGFRPQEKSSGS